MSNYFMSHLISGSKTKTWHHQIDNATEDMKRVLTITYWSKVLV